MQTDDSNTIFQANLNKSIDSGAISCKDLQVMLKWHFDVELHNDTGCDGKTNWTPETQGQSVGLRKLQNKDIPNINIPMRH